MSISINSKIEQLNKVGPAYLKKLHKLGINNIRDLFFHFPHRYDDFSQIIPIDQIKQGQTATISGEITQIKSSRSWQRKMSLTEAMIKDETGSIRAVWFNQPYLIQTLKQDKRVNLSGKVTFAGKTLCLSNPVYELIGYKKEMTHTGRLVPVYHETAGLSSRYLRYLIKPILYLTDQIQDYLPEKIKHKFQLINLAPAIKQIHFPDNLQSARQARQRMAFDELFLIQLTTLYQKQKLAQEKASIIPFNQKLIKSFVKELPFKLTDDQRLSAWEILQDIKEDRPMNRLLNGDVGSGKTIVALMAALETAKAGYQTALMAPTEILAKQHFQTLKDFLKKHGLNIALLTSSETKKGEKALTRLKLKKQLIQGKIDIIVGTHALIQEDLSFKNLSLAIVDEQHRFGVAQRAALQGKIYQMEDGLPTIPHLLSMTATPIPRTLTLTIYGDLDISLIKKMPKGRKKIITKIISPKDRNKTYNFIKSQIKQKKQAFVICPLIDESETLEVKSVVQEYERLSREIFPEFRTAMLHGKIKAKEKEEIMEKFKQRKIDILVSTSVVEVGIDIPNATAMIIEGAERFGLSQLHQFRGRIGRSIDQSYCFLFTESDTQKANQRLRAVVNSQDGFKLAEKDLTLRGPGDFAGVRQWGLPDLTMASLDDLELIKKSRQAAQTVLDENLINSVLKKRLDEFQQLIHLE